MSITTTKQLRKLASKTDADKDHPSHDAELKIDFVQQLTVSTMVTTMLEIIKVKKSHDMDEETRVQFPRIAKEIILLAEMTR